MRHLPLLLAFAACAHDAALSPAHGEPRRWAERAARVTITRDTWGIAHVHGPTDSDAVFGMIYAQAEDDFPRIEHNYLVALGRLAEAEGEAEVWRDLRARLYVDPADLQARYAAAPAELRVLLEAWADGLDFFLATHPGVRPRVLTRFEPWMALAFSEGSISGDIERISLADLEAFYAAQPGIEGLVAPTDPTGSNGIAIAPQNTAGGHALLLINPHTSFFFRSELQVTSDEGLDVYGAATWGQLFVYQGFNQRLGWMHTTSRVDNIDEFAETITGSDSGRTYRYGAEQRPVRTRSVTLSVRSAAGQVERTFTTYHTHHGPIVRQLPDGRWVSVALQFDPVPALLQSFGRNKAQDLAAFRGTLDLHTNASNNTIYADVDGHIAYFHANFVPRRDPRFDYTQPVDGADPATDWGPPLSVDESPLVLDPGVGWVYNSNNWPYTAAGQDSPARDAFPAYVDRGSENPRGLHAQALLTGRRDWTLDTLVGAAYDPHLPAFDALLPRLFAAYDALPGQAADRAALAEPVVALRAWDRRWAADSVETTLAITWGEMLPSWDAGPTEQVAALRAATAHLTATAGSWRVPWGDVNRFQRITGDILQPFTDDGPSRPVGFTAGKWGSLAAFEADPADGLRARYGTAGNSFVAAIELGDTVRARAITAGGASGDPASPHFVDQVDRYVRGDLRKVWLDPESLAAHTERMYHPGE